MAGEDLAWTLGIIGALCAPFISCAVVRLWSRSMGGLIVAVITSVVAISAPPIVSVSRYNADLEEAVRALDRDGDDLYSPDEMATWTDEERRSMERHIGDGGRNTFAFLVVPILAAAYAAVIAALYWAVAAYLGRRSKRGLAQTANPSGAGS